MFLFLYAFLFCSQASAEVVQLEFRCRPMNPPKIQGEEKFLDGKFIAPSGLKLEIAGMAGPSVDLSEVSNLVRSFYSDSSSSASATWINEKGDFAQLSMAYFGSWWGAILQFSQDLDLGSERISSGSSLEFRCEEKALTK